MKNFSPDREFVSSQEDVEKAQELFLSLIDKEIQPSDKTFVMQQLAYNFSLRESLVELENFELMSKVVAKDETLLNDGVLDIVGAQAVLELPEEDLFTVDLTEEIEEEMAEEVAEEEVAEEISEEKTNWAELQTEDELMEEPSLELPDLESFEEEVEASDESSSSFGEAIVEGAVAGGIIAGGIIAGQAIASGAAVSGLGIPDINIDGEINLPEFGKSEIEEISDEELFEDELSTDFDLDEMVEASKGLPEEVSEDILEDVQGELEVEEEIVDEVGEIFEETEVADIDTDQILELEELPQIEVAQLEEIPAEEESKEDVFDLNNFDFDMLEEMAGEDAEVQPVEQVEQMENIGEELVSLDSFENIEPKNEEPTQTGEELGEELSEEALDETSGEPAEAEISQVEEPLMGEIEEFDDEKKGDYTDIKELTSQVDEFLKDIELTDEQKGALSSEFLFEDEEEQIQPISFESEEAYSTSPETPSAEDYTPIEDLQSVQAEDDDKDVLKVLFKNGDLGDTSDMEFEPKQGNLLDNIPKNKKTLIAASVAGVILVSLVAGGIKLSQKESPADFPGNTQNIAQNIPEGAQGGMQGSPQDASSTGGQDMTGDMGAGEQDIGGQNLPIQGGQQMNSPDRDMGQAVSDAFTSEPMTASVTKVAWEVPEDLAYNDAFRKYLQIAGKNLKLTLQSNLLLATEMAYSSKVVVDLEINKDGSLKGSNIAVSSGSKQIDKIVLQSVTETLKYLKMPSSELSGQSVVATLIINF